jgi:hypothetical protein
MMLPLGGFPCLKTKSSSFSKVAIGGQSVALTK